MTILNDLYGVTGLKPQPKGFPLKPSTMLLTVLGISGSSFPRLCNVVAAVESMTVADQLAKMESQLDQLEDLTNEVFRPDLYDARDPNADVAQNIQAIRTDVQQLVQKGTARQQADAAKKYGEAFQKTCEATRKLVRACNDGTDKEKAEAAIQVVSQVSAVFPPPYGAAMGGLCSLTTMIMDLAWDCPGSSPFAAMLRAIQQMIDQAVKANNHLYFNFHFCFSLSGYEKQPFVPLRLSARSTTTWTRSSVSFINIWLRAKWRQSGRSVT